MVDIQIKTSDLKKALSIASLAIGDNPDTVEGQALFIIKNDKVFIQATNKDKLAASYFPIIDSSIEAECSFTTDPKKLQAVLSKSDEDLIRIQHNQERNTLNVFASEDKEAYISFPSMNPDDFLKINEELSIALSVKTIDTTILTTGIKFILGFLPNDEKSKKYSNLYVDKGILYGSNGANKVGAFSSSDIEGITDLNIRRSMLMPMASFIDKIGSSEVVLKHSSKNIIVSSPDGFHSFGFRKSILEMPKLPISIMVPDANGVNIDRQLLLKKITRLGITSRDELGLKLSVTGDVLSIKTMAERESFERIACTRVCGEEPFEFLLECKRFKVILTMFQSDFVNLYVDKTRCTVYNNGDFIVEEEGKDPVKKPFIEVGVVTLARPER